MYEEDFPNLLFPIDGEIFDEDKIEYEVWYLGHWHTDKRIDKMHFLFHDVEVL